MARSKITSESRTKAIQMRTEGHTYAEIVLALSDDGITLNWCKKNLSSIAVYDTHYFLMEELTPLTLRPEGISRLEFRTKIKTAYGIPLGDMIPEAIEKKTKRALPEGGFVRPDWMEPEAARSSQTAIVEAASLLRDRLDELHGEICALHPNASSWHVRDAILSMVTGSHPAGPIVQGQQMLDAVKKMEERVPQRSQAEAPAPKADHEYDSLCF
ncbi:hypothetical protein [Pseudomonas entomophila]|uniref:Uncharacterized protein n=2 Tax=Pseudomonas entomophila TaxID=312306 RepID=Q1ICI9_PSEE4|nr:hypothetical protein [Pseudomonas entomophila]WMW04576.1 hypothetical protein RAH46_19845 [Pseudomonas entomophila]CAK14624.1 hypothetical protein PSEEN1781 [Pseudomonas entomophila L48]